jgi:hypothetical protein
MSLLVPIASWSCTALEILEVDLTVSFVGQEPLIFREIYCDRTCARSAGALADEVDTPQLKLAFRLPLPLTNLLYRRLVELLTKDYRD